MAISINIEDSTISGNSQVLNNFKSSGTQDINVDIKNISVNDAAQILNNMTDVQISEIMQELTSKQKQLDCKSKEYKEVCDIIEKTRNEKRQAKMTLLQHLPNLLTGTISNIISDIIMRHR